MVHQSRRLVMVGLCLLVMTAPLAAAEVRNPMRYPLACAPRLKQAPVIDGNVDKREWFAAALLPQLTEYDAAIASPIRSKVYVGYTDTHLYLAFQFHRPVNAIAPRARFEGRNERDIFADDCWGLWLDPHNDWKSDFFMGGNASSGFWDRRDATPGSGDWNWNPEWSYKSRVTDTGWEGEIAIAFADLNVPTPKAGDIWGFDLYNHQRTPFGALLTNANRNNWWGTDGLCQLLFTDQPIAVRFPESGAFVSERRGGIIVEVVNASDAPVTVASDIKLYRRKSGAAGMGNNFLASLVSGANQAGSDVVKDARLDVLLADAMNVYEPVPMEDVPTSITVAAGKAGQVRAAVQQPAEYLVIHQVKINDQLVSARALPFLLPPPILVTLDPYLLTAQLLVAKVKLTDVEGWSEGSKLAFSLLPAAGGAAVATAEAPFNGTPEAEAALSLQQTQPGDYLVQVDVVDRSGQVRATRKEAYARPKEPVWHANALGRSVAVPSPWSPVVVQGDPANLRQPLTISVWGRRYVLGDQPGFVQVTTQEQDLFTSPMRLAGAIGGKPIQWTCRSRAITHQADDAVEVRSQFACGTVELTWIARFEFDGFVKVNYQLAGRPGDSIEELAVEASYRPAMATLYSMDMWLRRDVSGPDRTGAMPKPPERIAHRITQTSWVGNADGGLMANFQNDRDWSYDKKTQAIEVIPEQAQVLYRLRLIDKPTAMTRPRDIEFSLMATPVKPRPANYRDYRFLQITGFGNASRWDEMIDFVDDCKANNIHYIIVHSDWNEFQVNDIFGWPQIPTPELEDHLKKIVKHIHDSGMKVIFYTGWYLSMNSVDWNPWGIEMLKSPVESGGYKTMMTVFNNAYNDAQIHRVAEVVDRIGFDGIFWDSTLRCCASDNLYRPNEGWIDDNGQRQPSFPIWATRDLLKRLWVLFKHEKRQDGIIYAGNPGVPFMPVESFADVHHPGEGPEQHASPGHLLEKYSPAFGKARNMGAQYGIITEKTVKGPMGFNALMAANLPHDMTGKAHTGSLGWPKKPRLLSARDFAYGRHQHTALSIYESRQWIDVGTSQWLPYWRNQEYITTQPTENVLASMHLQPGDRALLVVSNLAGEGRDIRVKINPARMGFKPDQKLYVYDAMLEQVQYELDQDHQLMLSIENERYRLLMISGNPLDRAQPLRTLGDDLLAGRGAMESPDSDARPAGLTYTRHTDTGPVFFQDTARARSGKASLRIDRAPSEQVYIPVTANAGKIDVKPNTRYALRAFVLAEKEMQVKEGGAFQGAAVCIEGMGYGPFVGDYTGGKWVESRLVFDSGARTSVTVVLHCYGSGVLWVDDMELLELAP